MKTIDKKNLAALEKFEKSIGANIKPSNKDIRKQAAKPRPAK